jgi:hypothetical protein
VGARHAAMGAGADDFENFVASYLQEVRSLRLADSVSVTNDRRMGCSIK